MPRTATKSKEDRYEHERQRGIENQRAISQAGRDIAPIPDPTNLEDKARARDDFRYFCEAYMPASFPMAWSPDHVKVIDKIQTSVLSGGLFAMAMPRGSGKTTLIEAGAIWAILYGHRSFVCIIGSDEDHATNMLESIKSEIENNELLGESFPEVCYPVQKLEGITQRARGQLLNGESTSIQWSAKEVVFPTVPGSPASGSVIRVAGITGRVRGMKFKRPDGKSVRPDLVLIDDPQTDESARSPSQCAAREKVLAGAILGLAGPGKKIAGLMTLTVVRSGDLADSILDRNLHPAWQGERTKMVYAFPTNEQLWATYAEIRADSLRAGTGIRPATEFYLANRAAMDAGSAVAWPERFNHDEASAIQHAMNLRLQDEYAFFAEYQNEPMAEASLDSEMATADEIVERLNGHDRGVVPHYATRLTAFVDVQQKMLFWLVCAWGDDFTGAVVDYGTFPDQGPGYFTNRGATEKTLATLYPAAGIEGAIYAGLADLASSVLAREYRRDSGGVVRVDRCMIDANWGQSTEVVYQFCRESPHASVLTPSHGKYIGAGSIPMGEYKKKRGDRVGTNWRIPADTGKRAVRHVVYDTNFWKSFVHARLSVSQGDPGALTLFGRSREAHRLLADHLTAENRVRTEGRGREVDEWKQPADGRDNHWFDCLVGSAVGASILGSATVGHVTSAPPEAKPRVKFSELQRRKRLGLA